MQENQALRDKMASMQKIKDDEIAYLRSELGKYRKELAALKVPVTNTNTSTNTYNNNNVAITTSQIKRLLSCYSNAIPLNKITDISQVLDEDDELFLENIAYDQQKKILHKTLGDGIVNVYKTTDPKDQSIWNTDSSRLNYLIKHAINKKNSRWVIDKRGLQVTEKIIEPVLGYLKNKMCEYVPTIDKPRSFRSKGYLLELDHHVFKK